jgi:hypothetical protein
MATVILTLQLPRGGRGIPIATTTNPQVLCYFKQAVLREWQVKTEISDETEAMLAQLELERLQKALDTLIPETPEVEGV